MAVTHLCYSQGKIFDVIVNVRVSPQLRDDVIEPTSPPLSSPNSGGSHGEPADFLISPSTCSIFCFNYI